MMAGFDFSHLVGPKAPPQERTDMYLRRVGNGAYVRYELKSTSTEKVEWVSTQTDRNGNPLLVRQPCGSTREYSRKCPFSVAGKTYLSLNGFLRKQNG